MKDLFQKASTTSIIAMLLLLGTLTYCYLSHLVPSAASETTDTQIVQGLFGAVMLMLGYFFGSAKKQSSSIEQNADKITNNPQSINGTTTDNTQNTNGMKNICWFLPDFNNSVIVSDGNTVFPNLTASQIIAQMPGLYFSAINEDGDIALCKTVPEGSPASILTLASGESILSLDFIGGRPPRKPNK